MKKQKKRNNNVALVMVPGINDAPYDNDTFDIWIINSCFRYAERFDLLFDMHDWVGSDYVPKYYEELIKEDFPVVKPAHDPNIKHEVLYPDTLFKLFKFQLKHSACYMLAYAWWMGYRNIYFYGLTGDEFERHPYMGYAFYYILGALNFSWARGDDTDYMKIHFVNKMAMDNHTFYGMGLQWRKSDMMFEGSDNFIIKRWDDEESMLDTSKGRKQTNTE